MIEARNHHAIIIQESLGCWSEDYLCIFSSRPESYAFDFFVEVAVRRPKVRMHANQKLRVAVRFQPLNNFLNVADNQVFVMADMSPAGAVKDNRAIAFKAGSTAE